MSTEPEEKSIGHIIRAPWKAAQNFVLILPIVVSGTRWRVRVSPKSFGFILWAATNSYPKFIAIQHIVVDTFHWKSKTSTSWWCLRRSQGLYKVIRRHGLGTMNVCIKYYSDPFRSCWDTSVWTNQHCHPKSHNSSAAEKILSLSTKYNLGSLKS